MLRSAACWLRILLEISTGEMITFSAVFSIMTFAAMMSHASFDPLLVECHQRASPRALAKSISVMADRDLLRGEDDADWLYRILGIFMARARQPVEIFEVDG